MIGSSLHWSLKFQILRSSLCVSVIWRPRDRGQTCVRSDTHLTPLYFSVLDPWLPSIWYTDVIKSPWSLFSVFIYMKHCTRAFWCCCPIVSPSAWKLCPLRIDHTPSLNLILVPHSHCQISRSYSICPLPVQPGMLRCSWQFRSPPRMIQSCFDTVFNNFCISCRVSSTVGFAVLPLCGIYDTTTKIFQIGPSNRTHTNLVPTCPCSELLVSFLPIARWWHLPPGLCSWRSRQFTTYPSFTLKLGHFLIVV